MSAEINVELRSALGRLLYGQSVTMPRKVEQGSLLTWQGQSDSSNGMYGGAQLDTFHYLYPRRVSGKASPGVDPAALTYDLTLTYVD